MKTFTKTIGPWQVFARTGHRLLCSDGVIRAAELAPTADTFFSVPATIRIKGRRITGYYTGDEETVAPFRPVCVFRQHTQQDHPHSLPPWPDKYSPEHSALIAKAL